VHAVPGVAGDRERSGVRHQAEDFLVFAHLANASTSTLNTSFVPSQIFNY
jgi:hypothetical protein